MAQPPREILFLCHRIPYPPNKGDKVRSFNISQYLAEHYRVHLGAFVDDPADWAYRPQIEQRFGEVCLRPLNPRFGKLRSLSGLVTGAPLTLPYYRDARLHAWVRDLLRRRPISAVVLFSSAMAQYVENLDGIPRILDFVDVDSDKWRQYAERSGPAMGWIYRREARRLFDYERRIASRFDASLFVSPREAEFFSALAPETRERVSAVENGVDLDFFSPEIEHPNPYPPGGPILVFTGAMDYWPNIDAVQWFCREVFPELRSAIPGLRLVIAGARPAAAVRNLGAIEGVSVTGGVPDMRPYLAHADLAIAPLNIARGIQNKVLEAMAMGKPVLCSGAAAEGLDLPDGAEVRVLSGRESWIQAALEFFRKSPSERGGEINRRIVRERYAWDRCLAPLRALIDGE